MASSDQSSSDPKRGGFFDAIRQFFSGQSKTLPEESIEEAPSSIPLEERHMPPPSVSTRYAPVVLSQPSTKTDSTDEDSEESTGKVDLRGNPIAPRKSGYADRVKRYYASRRDQAAQQGSTSLFGSFRNRFLGVINMVGNQEAAPIDVGSLEDLAVVDDDGGLVGLAINRESNQAMWNDAARLTANRSFSELVTMVAMAQNEEIYDSRSEQLAPAQSVQEVSVVGETAIQVGSKGAKKIVGMGVEKLGGQLAKKAGGEAVKEVGKEIVGAAGKKVAGEAVKKTVATAIGALVPVPVLDVAVALVVSWALDKAGNLVKGAWDKIKPLLQVLGGGYAALMMWLAGLGQAAMFGAIAGGIGGAIMGGYLGTILIPIPIVGTLVGAGLGFVGGSALGGLAGAYLGSSGVSFSGAVTGAANVISSFTGGAALISVPTSVLVVSGVVITGATATWLAVTSAFVANPQKHENEGPPPLFVVEKTVLSPTSKALTNEEANNGVPIKYQVKITSEKNSPPLILTINDKAMAYSQTGPINVADSLFPAPKERALAPGESIVETYTISLKNKNVTDANLINTITVTSRAGANVIGDIRTADSHVAEAVVRIGEITDFPPFGWPLTGNITSLDAEDITVNGTTRPHCGTVFFPASRSCLPGGIDIAQVGSVRSTLDGEVQFAGFDDDPSYGLGGVVYIVSKTREWKTVYLHLGTPSVKTGDIVARGQVIGSVYEAKLPTTTGRHVHYQVLRGGVNWPAMPNAGACLNPAGQATGNIVSSVQPAVSQGPFACTN